MNIRAVFVLTMLLGLSLSLAGQSSSPSGASVSVPPVIEFSNIATDETGAPLGGTVTITFSLYNNAEGGSALWTETQNVQLDSTGHYSVYMKRRPGFWHRNLEIQEKSNEKSANSQFTESV